MFAPGHNAAGGCLVEKRHPRQRERRGGTCPPGDTAGGKGLCSLLPTSAAFRLMPLVPRRSKPGDQEPKSRSLARLGAGAGSARGPDAVLSPHRGAAGSLCDKLDQHGGWQ